MLTNNANLSLSMAVMFAVDEYDHSTEPNTISVTALIKPLRQLILGMRVAAQGLEEDGDVSSLYASRIGTGIHTMLENTWTDGHYKVAMERLGYPKRVIDSIVINPEQGSDLTDKIPIYVEVRSSKSVAGFTITGKFDQVIEGRVEDLKTSSSYAYQDKAKKKTHALQGSIYRWLNQSIITDDNMAIQHIFMDWSMMNAKRDPTYPQSKVLEEVLPLLPIRETQQYVENRVADIVRYMDADQDSLPLCSDEDLWRRDPLWKYYKNPNSTGRSTKNFTNAMEAEQRLLDDGSVGKVVLVQGQVKACDYCPGAAICTQRKQLIADGSLPQQ